MVACKVSYHEIAQHCDNHDGIGGDSWSHLGDSYDKDDKKWYNMEVDPEHAIGGLAVVIESAIRT